MKTAAFFVCMAIIAQTNAAPTPEPGQDREFDLPPMARAGFELSLIVPINDGYDINKLNVKILSKGDEIPEICANNNIEGKHICIYPDEELQDKLGRGQSFLEVRVGAHLNRSRDTLRLSVHLNDNYGGYGFIPLEDFEKLKHFSVGGIVNSNKIQTLHFDFSNEIEGS